MLSDLYKGIKDFKKGYQTRVNVIKYENEELLWDSNSILNGWKDYIKLLYYRLYFMVAKLGLSPCEKSKKLKK